MRKAPCVAAEIGNRRVIHGREITLSDGAIILDSRKNASIKWPPRPAAVGSRDRSAPAEEQAKREANRPRDRQRNNGLLPNELRGLVHRAATLTR